MDRYYEAISFFRRRNYEKCVEVCNTLLQIGQENNTQIFTEDDENTGNNRFQKKSVKVNTPCPVWMIEGVWQLKMRALTQRVYIDDLDTNDNGEENEEIEFERIATAARPGTSIKTAFQPRPSTGLLGPGRLNMSRRGPVTAGGGRPMTGMLRPGTTTSRPGTGLGRPPTRCGTARRVRMTSAAAFGIGDKTASFFQAARLNPTIYAERPTVTKALFLFLFYHEGDVEKAYTFCDAVEKVNKGNTDWWWDQQLGRCLLALNKPRKAEEYLLKAKEAFKHPDTVILLSKVYLKLEEPLEGLKVLDEALSQSPNDVCLLIHKGRIYEEIENVLESVAIYRKITQLDPINAEALACIAMSHFYNHQPELALLYYRRILSLGAHSPEVYCNIGLCCLYGGQIDLVLPCFQRAVQMAETNEQKADIWYNFSFVALVSFYKTFSLVLKYILKDFVFTDNRRFFTCQEMPSTLPFF